MRNLAATMLLLAATATATAEDHLVYAQDIMLTPPDGFELAYNDVGGGRFISEFLRPGDTVDAWQEMVTVTGVHPETPPSGASPALDFAMSIRQGYEAACPDSFSAYEQPAPTVPGAVSVFAGNLNCGEVAGSGQSQAMTFVVVVGREEIFTYQWAIQGAPWQGATAYDSAFWQPLLATLGTGLHLCDVPEGQTDCPPE